MKRWLVVIMMFFVLMLVVTSSFADEGEQQKSKYGVVDATISKEKGKTEMPFKNWEGEFNGKPSHKMNERKFSELSRWEQLLVIFAMVAKDQGVSLNFPH